jgi:hypothetical protein
LTAVLTVACSAPAQVVAASPPDAAEWSTLEGSAAEPAHADSGREDAGTAEDGSELSDATDALEVIFAEFTEENAPMRLLHRDDAIDLIRAPQGGHVALLGAQIRNVSTTAAILRVRMRRPDTGFIVAEEKRTVAMIPVPGNAGTLEPDLRSRSQVAHVPLCPDYDAIDVVDRPLDVEIQVTALYTDPPRIGSARLQLVPACRQTTPEEHALCRCECEANYALGKCATDARAP